MKKSLVIITASIMSFMASQHMSAAGGAQAERSIDLSLEDFPALTTEAIMKNDMPRLQRYVPTYVAPTAMTKSGKTLVQIAQQNHKNIGSTATRATLAYLEDLVAQQEMQDAGIDLATVTDFLATLGISLTREAPISVGWKTYKCHNGMR